MGYFPFFVDITGIKGLIVGGGTIALRKAEKLLPFGPDLTVTAPEIVPELAALPGVTLQRRPFEPALLEGACFVIAATDDRRVNREISLLCRARNIPVNAVDDKDACTFLFPALVKQGNLCVGITTGGSSPAAAAWLREQIERAVPSNMEEILDHMQRIRLIVQETLPEQERQRAAALSRVFAACIHAGRPLERAEFQALLGEKEEKHE